MEKLDKLFDPATIGNLHLRNRIVMPAIGTNFASTEGAATERLVNYYSERAKGGVGLIIVEATCIDTPAGKLAPIQLSIDDDKFITGLRDVARSIHENGGKAAIQLTHAGRQTNLINTGGAQPVSSSSVPCPSRGGEPRSLSVDEIKCLVRKYAEAARRAKAAGFDAVEIHGGHGWLIAQFLSTYTNKRSDEYGYDLEGRAKFALDIVGLCRKVLGKAFPIIFKISGAEYVVGGLELQDTTAMAGKLQDAGVDVFHVSAGIAESGIWTVQPMAFPQGCLIHLAEGFKKTIDAPIIAVGRINDPRFADRVLREKKADFIAMGRALIADPQLPRKAAEGNLHEIRRCIACNIGCDMYFSRRWPISCTINPSVGREKEYGIRKAENPRRVLVIGGGPAGMEAAIVSALRGHEVKLFEMNQELGGQLLLASKPPHKYEIANLTRFLSNEVQRVGVEIKLSTEVTSEIVKEEDPDVVVVSTGAEPLIPQIRGVNLGNVVTAWDVLSGRVESAGEVALVVGGGMVGCETAEFMASTAKEIIVVARSEDIASDMEPSSRFLLKKRLSELGIRTLIGTSIEEITNQGLVVENPKQGRLELMGSIVVLARGSKPRAHPKLQSLESYAVGDCVTPRGILEAIHEGSWIGHRI